MRNIVRTLEGLLKETTVLDNRCMEWNRAVNTDGYPRMAWPGKGTNGKVHRIVYELANPEEDITSLVIRHTCDNTKCINPQHLLSGTYIDNVNDRVVRNRSFSKAQFTHEQVKTIRELHKLGYSQHKISRIFNTTQGAIRSIVIMKSYRYVE